MYLIRIGHVTYERKDGAAFTLVEAMQAVYGAANACVLREDGTAIVTSAGSASMIHYLPTNRDILRRPARHARERWLRAHLDDLRAAACGW